MLSVPTKPRLGAWSVHDTSMTSPSSLSRQSAFSVGSTLFQLVTSVGSGILLARVLGPAGKGQVFLAFQYAAFGAMVFSLGLGPAYLYFVRKRTVSVSQASVHASGMVAVALGVNVVLTLFGMPFLRWITDYSLSDGMVLLAQALLIVSLIGNYLGFLLMSLDRGVEISSITAVLANAFYLFALVILVGASGLGVAGALVATMTPTVVKIALSAIPLWPALSKERPAAVFGLSGPFLRYGVGAFSASFMLNSVFRIDTFFVNAMAGASALGVYSVAVNFAELMLVVPSAVGVAAFPHLTTQGEIDRLSTAAQVARLSVFFSLCVSIGIALIGYPLIVVAFGDAFSGAYPVVLALLPGLLALTTVYGYGNYFSSSGRPFTNTAIFGTGAIANVGANVLLIPRFGIVGAGISSSISYILMIALMIYIVKRESTHSVSDLLVPTRSDLTLCWAKVAALLPSWSAR